MYGCNCDDSMYGPDCSKRACPTGDAPLTESVLDNPQAAVHMLLSVIFFDRSELQETERQRIECKADSGYVVLSFRNKHTDRIPLDLRLSTECREYLMRTCTYRYYASEHEVQGYLEALPTITNDFGPALSIQMNGTTELEIS